METILQSLQELAGVNASVVIDASGQVVAHRGKSVYDRGLLDQVGGLVVKAIDSVALHHEDWDGITAHYGDGKLLLRNLGGANPHFLVVVADNSLNQSFALVAMRVAVTKLKKALEAGPPAASGSQPPGAMPMTPLPASGSASGPHAIAIKAAAGTHSALSSSGLTWSGLGASAAASTVAVADEAASAFLTRCSRALAEYVGPMAKLYVKEAIRRVSPTAPFAMTAAAQLLADVARTIESSTDRAAFLHAMEQ
jgi:predicted regulator of Ras-like GTPase activity (Roadblock/LC7/MglB family)